MISRLALVIAVCCFGHMAGANKNCNADPKSFWQKGWAITAFGGPLTSQTSSKIFFDPDFDGTGILAIAGSKEVSRFWDDQMRFEIEGQAVQHIGKQTHFELNPVVLILRWTEFPWNKYLPTTFALGDGVSIATSKPKQEVRRRGRRKSNQVLNYVMAELTFSLPSCPNWAVVARYHHRSGLFGAFNHVHDASTAFAGGFKYWF